jgi:hypothetical protein
MSGLKDRLLAPELVGEAVRAFTEEMPAADRHAVGPRSRPDV